MKVPHALHNRAAFSLVEVTLAIGIVSFAILSVLGTMSVGLSTVRDAKKDTTSAQIASQIGSGMSQTPFTNLATYATKGRTSSTIAAESWTVSNPPLTAPP